MTEIENTAHDEKAGFGVYIAFSFFIAAGLILTHFSFEELDELAGPDCYVRLTRVTDLYETGNWYHPARMKSNTPYGDTVPWGRPFDVLLLAGAVPLSLFMNFDSALWWWGYFISPVLLVAALLALYWAVKPLLSQDAALCVVFVVALQFGVLQCFKTARPDHHSLQALFFVILLGIGLRMAKRPFRASWCWWGGAVASLALSTSVESFVMIGLMIAILGAFWVVQRSDFLQKSVHFCGALLFFTAAALLVERPPADFAVVEFDKISIVYVLLFGLIAAFWAVTSLIDKKTPLSAFLTGRLCCGLIGLAAIAFVMWRLFPKFYRGPLADMDPRIVSIWFSHISELQPLVTKTESLIPFIQALGPFVISVFFVAWLLLKADKKKNTNGWILMAVLIAGYSFLAFRQVRWLVYPQMLLSVVLAEVLWKILNRMEGIKRVFPRALAKSAVISVFSIGFLALGFAADWVFDRDDSHGGKDLSLVPLCVYLNEQTAADGGSLRLLTENDFASEILYRTECEVVGSNYHRNGQGIWDNHVVMTAKTDEEALDILEERKIDLVILCPDKTPRLNIERSRNFSTFSLRLCEGQIPSCLTQVELPEGLKDDFLVFEVNFFDL